MAALSAPHWDGITPNMGRLLSQLGQQPFTRRFYLAGGTALSLQIGHRRSVDLDFFSEIDELDDRSRSEIVHSLSSLRIQVIENVGGNLLLLIDGIRTGFFSYGYPLVQETYPVEKIRLASLVDIGLMKCDALISRGSRKDFYDLFYIARTINFEQLLQLGEKKYALFRDFPLMVLESMRLFDNADRDVQPEIFEDILWEEVKQFFIDQAQQLSSRWFG
jgi:predicted nucleotidyltransferase component of viral defense system